MSEIRYSATIRGDFGNYHWPAEFDAVGRHVGISQIQGTGLVRVLLSPKQVRALVAFVTAAKPKRRKRKPATA
jgi:hypothetical protein